jgi:hypothetical protein
LSTGQRRLSGDPRRLSGVQSGKIDKSAGKRTSTAVASVKSAMKEMDNFDTSVPRRATESALSSSRATLSPLDAQLPWRRRKKGETMSQLYEAGFFPEKEMSAQMKNAVHVKLPPPLTLVGKQLPPTPGSAAGTPTEVYQPRNSFAPKRASGKPKRSPLTQISETNVKANTPARNEEVSPTSLTDIPENHAGTENTPPSSGVATPVATQIHLPQGSVITVTPPGLTAWQRHIYIQGPIKLSKPAVVPRKNSVASMDPFQEAIDKLYQDALVIPRRRSDDAVVDDICEWYDQFGFDEIIFEGDKLLAKEADLEEIGEVDEMEDIEERFATPPLEPDVTPVEKLAAKEVVERLDPNATHPPPAARSLDTAEALRTRGIARRSHTSQVSHKSTPSQDRRKESLTIPKTEDILSFTSPRPESMIGPGLEAMAPKSDSDFTESLVDPGGFDWDDEVSEISKESSWVAPAVANKKYGLSRRPSKKSTRNPIMKVRRFVATASSVL